MNTVITSAAASSESGEIELEYRRVRSFSEQLAMRLSPEAMQVHSAHMHPTYSDFFTVSAGCQFLGFRLAGSR